MPPPGDTHPLLPPLQPADRIRIANKQYCQLLSITVGSVTAYKNVSSIMNDLWMEIFDRMRRMEVFVSGCGGMHAHARTHTYARTDAHTYIPPHTHTHTNTHTPARTHTNAHASIRTHTHAHAHARTDPPTTRILARTHESTRERTHAHAHAHARTHARTHTHTHPRTHARAHARAHTRTHTHVVIPQNGTLPYLALRPNLEF